MSLNLLFGELDLWSLHLPIPVALAAVTVIAYLIGQRRRDEQALKTWPLTAR